MSVFRQVRKDELCSVREFYRGIVDMLNKNGIGIWDEEYPFCCLEEDIEKGRLWMLERGGKPLALMALTEENRGQHAVKWPEGGAPARYIERFGVSAGHQGQGIGGEALRAAEELVKAEGADCLRLFVADINLPAIAFYEKNGYIRAGGMYHEVIDEDCVFNDYGYEKKL